MLPLLLLLTQSPDPRALLERAIDATRQQKAERARFFGREDVQTFRIEGTKRKRLSWNTYEALVLDGQVRYRRTQRDGKPLPPKRQELQPPGKRWAMRFEQVLAHHELALVGEDSIGGRPVWVLQTRLRPDAPAPTGLEDLGLLGALRLWLDRESGIDLQSRLEVTRSFRGLERGSVIETRLMKFGGVFVAARALIRIPGTKSSVETVQTYSDYKRFSSDVTIRFDPEPAATP